MITYYHGTSTVLEPGAVLVPGFRLGRDNYEDLDPGHTRRVHMTTSLGMAVFFGMAAVRMDPDPEADLCVYVVTPTGPVLQDPGGVLGEDHVCLRATVVREVDPAELRQVRQDALAEHPALTRRLRLTTTTEMEA